MKKFLLVAAVMLVGVGTAFGSSLSVPFFLDNAPEGFPVVTGTAAFIGIHNNTGDPILVTIDYYDAGQDGTVDHQTPANDTFILPANASYSFRPVANDPPVEGITAGALVPNMPGGENAGSAIITWIGGPTDIQGRVTIVSGNGSQSAYLLPPGF